MKTYTRRRLLASVKLGIAAIPFSILFTMLAGEPLNPGRLFVLPFGFGFAVGAAELFLFRGRFERLSFLAHLLVKSLLITAVIYAAYAVLNVLDVVIDGITWRQWAQQLVAPDVWPGLGLAVLAIAFLLFFVRLDRLLGPGVLLGYVTGRYHHPRRERRVFMFLDLKGSTALADGMDAARYFDFLHEYFSGMSEPILETGAEIYQYVGDEVVLSWKMKDAREEANCVRVFFLIEDHIRAQADHFRSRYGVVPEFKAGLHGGEVITAQIGDLKSEIVYNGDVLNTTARIQASCNPLGRRLLASAALLEEMRLGPEYRVESVGAVPLRGKADAVELVAVERNEEPV